MHAIGQLIRFVCLKFATSRIGPAQGLCSRAVDALGYCIIQIIFRFMRRGRFFGYGILFSVAPFSIWVEYLNNLNNSISENAVISLFGGGYESKLAYVLLTI